MNSTIDTKSPVGLDRSDSAVSARDHNTVGSTGSSSFTSENNHADQIDDIWLQMLSIKRGAELNNNANQNFMAPTSNFSNKNENAFEYFAQTPQEQFRFQAETPFGQSGTTATGGSGGNNYGQAETPLTAIRNSEFDVFQGLSFEDIFQG